MCICVCTYVCVHNCTHRFKNIKRDNVYSTLNVLRLTLSIFCM